MKEEEKEEKEQVKEKIKQIEQIQEQISFLRSEFLPFLKRYRSPAMSTFILSWIVWNWKIVLMFFSGDNNTKEFIVYVDSIWSWENDFQFFYLCTNNLSWIGRIFHNIVMPSGILLFLAYPFHAFIERVNKRMKGNATVVEHWKEVSDFEIEITSNNEEIKSLKNHLKNRDKQITDERKQLGQKVNNLHSESLVLEYTVKTLKHKEVELLKDVKFFIIDFAYMNNSSFCIEILKWIKTYNEVINLQYKLDHNIQLKIKEENEYSEEQMFEAMNKYNTMSSNFIFISSINELIEKNYISVVDKTYLWNRKDSLSENCILTKKADFLMEILL